MVEVNSKLELLNACLNSNNKEFDEYYLRAKDFTVAHFGNKRQLFNPIYISDVCLADCPYCGFRVSNKKNKRKTLKTNELINEANFLINRGVKNILLLAGDYMHKKYVEMLVQAIHLIKKEVNPNWLGIEVATLEIDEYKQLRQAGSMSVTVFQETYNRKRYSDLHSNTEYKGDFDFRYNAQERAIKAGFDEVGFGVLYGVGFWKEDTIQMAEHALEIKNRFPDVKLRFSFPRLQMSSGLDESCISEKVTQENITRAIVGIRLLFPEASIVLTGRESVDFLIEYASISNILGYNGTTSVGGYTIPNKGLDQFLLDSKNIFLDFKNKISTRYVLD